MFLLTGKEENMIQLTNVTKQFEEITALDNISLTIPSGEIFGLVGTNGAGKSTLLRLLTGILKADHGQIQVNGQDVFENEDMKQKIFYISDDIYVFPNATPSDMANFYKELYPAFDMDRFPEYLKKFNLKETRRIATFSKGMKKQLFILIGLCTGANYLLCDETFDGLDPVMRQAVKSLFANELMDRDFTPVIASHNLRELEDICDRVGLLHEGGLLLEKDLSNLKEDIHKLQCVIRDTDKRQKLFNQLQVIDERNQGSLLILTVRGKEEDILSAVREADPVFCELIPLSFEEIFVSETEVAGYEIKNLIL